MSKLKLIVICLMYFSLNVNALYLHDDAADIKAQEEPILSENVKNILEQDLHDDAADIKAQEEPILSENVKNILEQDLHDDAADIKTKEKPILSENVENILERGIKFSAQQCCRLAKIVKDWPWASTLMNSQPIERECQTRRSSKTYQALQVASVVAFSGQAMVSILCSEDWTNAFLTQVAGFAFFYGIGLAEAVANFSIQEGEPINLELVKNIQRAVFFYLYPSSFCNALMVDKVGNELAARFTSILNCGTPGKDVAFFFIKNCVRALVMLDNQAYFSMPAAGNSEFPKDFKVDMNKIYGAHKQGFLYGLHFMWIYRGNNNNTFVFPERDKHSSPIFGHLEGWSINSNAHSISLWYDSHTTTLEQVKATEELFAFHNLKCGAHCTPIKLRDFAELDFYKTQEDRILSMIDSKKYFWALADWFRVAMLNEEVKECQDDCIQVYNDLDNLPIKKEWMLNFKTLKKLSDFGILIHERVEQRLWHAPRGLKLYETRKGENSMILLTKENHNPDVLNDILQVVLGEVLERGKNLPDDQYSLYYGRFISALMKHFGVSSISDLPTKCTPTIKSPDINTSGWEDVTKYFD